MVVIPILAESLYSPGLPELAKSFAVSTDAAENTLSIYLLGFAFGNLLWGHLSDVVGRRPVILVGFSIFLVSTLVCCLAQDFDWFMLARFLQAFGGSVSITAQSINRDLFTQRERIGVSASIGTSVSLSPAIGALVGGYVMTFYEWRLTFWILLAMSAILVFYLYANMRETKTCAHLELRSDSILQAVLRVWSDRNLLAHGTIIGLGLGLMYSFLGEGSFYCINGLGMTSASYSVICAMGALAYAGGCQLANTLINFGVHYKRVMAFGLMMSAITYIIFIECVLMQGITPSVSLTHAVWYDNSANILMAIWVMGSVGLSLVLTPSFALVLQNQKDYSGVGASWFGFINNIINALTNATMAYMHSENLWVMPSFFLFLCVAMALVFSALLDKTSVQAENVA